MNHPSPSLSFQWLFDIALRDYEKQTGTKLVDHPLAKQLEVCDSVDSISAFLQERACAFREFRGEDDGKVMRSLNRVVYVLYTLSTYSALGEGVGLVCLKAPFKTFNSLRLTVSHSLPQKQYLLGSPSYSPYGFSFVPMRHNTCIFLRLTGSLAGYQRH